MSDQKESSVLFSLKELMNIEEDRLKSEQSALEAQARAEREAKEAAERTARESEERRIREEEERRRAEEMRRREEQARLEAIQHGEVERARAEAEARARMEAMAAQQRHEQQLATIQTASGNKKLKVTVGIVGALAIIGSVIGGVAFKIKQEENEKIALQNKMLEEKAAALEAAIAKAESKERDLNDQLKNAQSEADRVRILAELAAAKAETEKVKQGGGGARPSGPARPTPAQPSKPKCPPGDPLCTDI